MVGWIFLKGSWGLIKVQMGDKIESSGLTGNYNLSLEPFSSSK